METILKTYIRNKDSKQPRGVAVAIRKDNKVDYGFSLINAKMDKWDKTLGTKIAIARAEANAYQLPAVPEREEAVLEAFKRLERRALRYFKEMNPEDIALSGHLGFDLDTEA